MESNPSGKSNTTAQYENRLSSPAITHTTETIDAGYITKTETIVEFSRVPIPHPEAAAVPQITSPVNNFSWWYKPKSRATASGAGRTYVDEPKNETGIHKSNNPTDPSMHQQYFDICRKEADETHMPNMSITGGWAKEKALGKEAQLKARIPPESIFAAPTQVSVTPYVLPNVELLLPTIDSREAARRYGGVAISSPESYAPAIDSREAAWKYRGQIF